MDEEQATQVEPAFVLDPGRPYVPGWADAQQAVQELLAELAGCGLALPHARPEVTAAGVGVVELGRVTPRAARLLARLLAEARIAGRV